MAIAETENLIEGQPAITEKEGPTEKSKVTKTKKKKAKSQTPVESTEKPATDDAAAADEIRATSMTPGPRSSRSHTPLSLYVQRRSEDPTLPIQLRSITPFINRQSKEKTPFELGKDIRNQLIAHKMVFDRASCMDISDKNDYEPARYITSDVSVVDRASVMDVSNVEVIYMVEEFDEAEYEEHLKAELAEEAAKKKKAKKALRKSKSVSITLPDNDGSPSPSVERESSAKPKTKTVKKKVIKKKEDDDDDIEKSPPPVELPKLKLELGGGSKFNKKLFEQKPPPPSGPDAKPPPGRAKVTVVQMEAKKSVEIDEEKTEDGSESRDGSEFKSSEREFSQNPDDEDENEINIEEEEKEPTPEPTEEELAQREAERIAREKIEAEQRRLERKERERIAILRNQMAEVERWNRIREDEGVEFMNRIKRFIAQKRDDPTHPCFVNHLPNATVMEGKDLRISCSVNGTDLEIMWFKNGREIHPSDKYVVKVNLYDVLSLEILNCEKRDSGEYMCIITNGKSQATTTCFVSVYDASSWKLDEPCPPNIDEVHDSYHFANDELMIECRVHGTPRPVITWYRNDNEIKPNQTYNLTEKSHGIYALSIKGPTPHDTGIYEIKASNSRGDHVRKHIVEFFVTTEKVVY